MCRASLTRAFIHDGNDGGPICAVIRIGIENMRRRNLNQSRDLELTLILGALVFRCRFGDRENHYKRMVAHSPGSVGPSRLMVSSIYERT